MNKFYHRSFIFPGVPNMRDLEPAFSESGDDWIRVSATTWIIWTAKDTNAISYRVMPLLDMYDNFIISEMNPRLTFGRMPPWVWTWINAKSPGSVVVYDVLSPPRPALPKPY
jgi:hypothetical protein